ncbi:MAG TPA: DUF4231 domain-containing protein [Myxococcaceae bacterium]|jgi:uncharacterized protein (DUF4415 family)
MTTSKPGGVSAEELAWKRYRAWAKTARQLKSAHERSYRWVTGLSLLGAIAGIIAHQIGTPAVPAPAPAPAVSGVNHGVAVMSALCVAVSTYLAAKLLGKERETQWVQARGIAEAIKSQLYLYWMRVEPYQESSAEAPNPDMQLIAKVQALEKTEKDLHREEPTEEEMKASPVKAAKTIEDYIKLRITDQIAWYRKGVTTHQTRMRNYQVLGIFLGLIGTVLGVFGATDSGARLVGWVAVVSTAAMGVAGLATAGRHQYLVATYRSAADQLEYLLGMWTGSKREQADDRRLVIESEATLRAENSAWVAENSTPVSAPEAQKPKD